MVIASLVLAAALARGCPSLVAHDGYSGAADGTGPVPPDSVEALQWAARLGSRAVKFDVRWSRDGVPVVIHNPTVYASTGYRSGGTVHHHHGPVAGKTAAELTRLHLLTLGGAWTPYRLPSAKAMLRAAVAAGDTSAIIEIKVPVITAAQVTSLRAATAAAGAGHITSVQTFFPQNIPVLQQAWPAARIALLEHAPVVVPPPGVTSAVLQASAVTPAAVAMLHAAGITAGAYTSGGSGLPDTVTTWRKMRDAGISQIFTNDARGFLAWRAAGCPG